MNINKHKIKGITGTIVVHGIVLALLFLFAFTTPLPLPGGGEIMINFGTEDEGAGIEEPRKAEVVKQEVKPQQVKVTDKEENITQDYEDAPALNKEKDKVKKETKKEEVKTTTDKTQQQVVEAEKPKEVNQKALFPGKKTDGETTGEGETGKQGNQGSEEGSPDSKSRTGSQGSGYGDGIGFDLGGRSALSLPKPDYSKQKYGKVVVEVTVDRQGNVTKAEPGKRGSTTLDSDLLKAAEKAALKAKFDVSLNAPEYQVGTITYVFKLN